MGRTNLVILFLGLFGCVTLSMMMKHVVTVKKQANVHPAVSELYSVFREQLQKPPALDEEEGNGRKTAVLTVVPKATVKPQYEPRFAKAIGGYFKQFVSADFQFDALAVVVKRETGERRFDIPVRGRGFSRFGRGTARKKAKAVTRKATGKKSTAQKATGKKSTPQKATGQTGTTAPKKPAAPPKK